MTILQYFVFDKSGNHILEANGIPCSSEQEVRALADTMMGNYKQDPQFKDLNLLLSCGNEIIFNSKEA